MDMESFTWMEQFITGLQEVDDQHQALVKLVNHLGQMLAENRLDPTRRRPSCLSGRLRLDPVARPSTVSGTMLRVASANRLYPNGLVYQKDTQDPGTADRAHHA